MNGLDKDGFLGCIFGYEEEEVGEYDNGLEQ
jgi:hypothetical protein